MGRSRYRITEAGAPHFLTCTVLHWIPVFTRPATVDIVLGSLRYLQQQGLCIYAWVILENDLHLVAQSDDLGRDLARFKSYTARSLLDYLRQHRVTMLLEQLAYYKKAHKADRRYQFWQEGSHPELVFSDEMMRQKIEYIHQNPVKRGYVSEPEHWRYSSARHYAGQPGLLEVTTRW
ncbi:REP-associated tyrosine transposase [Zobellella maritima]|uniref:REP-associated tyrosine transposase n=1 Tax=Zobellella maritima TaxID=2059725 RepID=UPI000E306A8A|nr:transposase [Zobellella maritima]